MVFTLYRHVACFLYPREVHLPWGSWRFLRCLPGNHSNSPSRAWWEGRQVHLLNWLQGTWIRWKASGQQVKLLLWSPSSWPPLLGRDQACAWCVFCQHFSGTRKDRVCKNQGSLFNIIMTALKTVTITQNQREKRRTSLGKLWGEKTDPTLLFTVTEVYRNSLVSL